MTPHSDAEFEISKFLRRVQWAAVGVAGLWLIGLLSPILTPFVCAALLAWLGNPLANRLERLGCSRNTAVVLVFVTMTLAVVILLLILIPMVEQQVVTLISSLPEYRDWFMGVAAPWIQEKTGFNLKEWLDPDTLIDWVRNHWKQAGGFASTAFSYVSRSGMAMVTWTINIVLIPVLTFYFLRDWNRLIVGTGKAIPRNYIGMVSQLAYDSEKVLGAFLRGQFLVMLALGTIYAVGLSLIGLKLGLLIGIIAGLISFIPYVGATSGIVLAIIAALVQAQGADWTLLILVGVVFLTGQLLESYVLTPRIVGDSIGLHPVIVMFSVMAGGQLFGFVGMLIALPVAAVINVLLRYVHERYIKSDWYKGDHTEIMLDHREQPISANTKKKPKKAS